MDETGICLEPPTDKTLFHKGEKCSGGKKAKLQLNVMLCVNMFGKKEKNLCHLGI